MKLIKSKKWGIGFALVNVFALIALFLIALSPASTEESGVEFTHVGNRGGSLSALNAGGTGDNILADESHGLPVCSYYTLQSQIDDSLLFICHEEVAPTPEPTLPPVATGTPEPTPTSGPVGSLPLCTDHADTAYHGLVSEDESCHYNHTHFGDPSQLDWLADLTDSPWPFETGVAYPHQTPNENAVKHTGYIYSVNSTASDISSDDFECVRLRNSSTTDGCVYAWRIQTHTVGGSHALNVRIHSLYGQVWVGNPDGTIGSVSTGGWVDWGHLMVPYKRESIPTSQDGAFELGGIAFGEVSRDLNQPPYRAGEPQSVDGTPGRYAAQWNMCSNQGGAHTHAICFDFVNFRDWGGVDVNDPTNILLACPDMDCENNHSNIRPYEIRVTTPPELGTGLINFSGWTDLHGNIVDEAECVENEFGVFPCAPLEIRNVQAGTYLFRVELGTNRGADGPQDRWQEEYDTSPPGEYWIKYPYRHSDH